MSQYIRPFEAQADTQTIAVTASSAATALNATGIGNRTVRLVNSGSNITYFKLGDSTVTTSASAGTPMLPNTIETFFLRRENTHIAVIGTVANTLYVTVGESA